MKISSSSSIFKIKLILSLSIFLPIISIAIYLSKKNSVTQFIAILFSLIGYNFLIRTLIGLTVTFFLRNKTTFNYNGFWLKKRKNETKLYKMLKIKKWKKSTITAMPEQFDIQHNSIDIILKNTVQAELVHVLIVPSVLIPIFLFGHTNYFLIVTILSIISAIWDTQYIILQRFNRPRILIMKDAIKQDII